MVSVAMLFFSIVTLFLVDFIGRKILLLISAGGVAVALTALGLSFAAIQAEPDADPGRVWCGLLPTWPVSQSGWGLCSGPWWQSYSRIICAVGLSAFAF